MNAETTNQARGRGIARTLTGAVSLMRPRQWVKNAFVFAPVFFTPAMMSARSIWSVFLVFVCFCCISSGVYCFNDLRDRESDKNHPKKRLRPLPSGRVTAGAAVALGSVLMASGFGLALAMVPAAAPVMLLYVVINVAYSVVLKNIAIVDVLIISFGFVLRVYGGAAVIGVVPTPWIQICAGLLALFIALAKRRDDVVLEISTEHRISLSGYTRLFLDVCIGVTLSALLVSYMIFTLNDEAMTRLGSNRLFLTVPFVIAGIFRYLQLTLVFERSGSPTELVFKDGFLTATVAGWLLVYAYLIYL
jgi:decaprenyl-phosphate phosphoribosyltransferase